MTTTDADIRRGTSPDRLGRVPILGTAYRCRQCGVWTDADYRADDPTPTLCAICGSRGETT